MKSLRFTACDLWSIKTIETDLKFIFPVSGISFRMQHLTCPLIDHRVTIHHNVSLKSFPCEFPHCIFHQLLIIYSLINDLVFSKFIQTRDTGRVSEPKIIYLYFVMVSLMASSSSSFAFVQFPRGIFNFFASCNSDVLFIYYYFCNSRQVTKIF